MDKEAHRQAWERLNKARSAQKKLVNAASFPDVDEAWSDFLTAASGIYSKLEKGTRGHPKAEPWFGRIKQERKSDELLRYIHHARNADEHGIKRITEHKRGGIGISAEGSMLIRKMSIRKGRLTVDATPNSPGSKLLVNHIPASVVLVEVFDDRFNDSFPPPTKHLEQPLAAQTPQVVASLAIEYLEKLVSDAGQFLN